MTDHAQRAYAPEQWLKAVTTGAVLGWGCYTAIFLAAAPTIGVFSLLFFVGLPIAFFIVFPISGPVLWFLMKWKVSWRKAALVGALIHLMIVFVLVIAAEVSLSNSPSAIDPGMKADDWARLAKRLAINGASTAASGCAIGLVVRWRIGPGLG